MATPSPAPRKPAFQFDMSQEAAEKNFCILAKYSFDVEKALAAQHGTPMAYGSEFRPPQVLERVFGHHPLWYRMKPLLTGGSNWPLLSLSTEDRAEDIHQALAFGNHKGATSQPKLLKELVTKDITHGYAMTLPLSKLRRVPGAILAPMNIMRQDTIDAAGNIVDKDRLTHDQSFGWDTGGSVNSRVKKDLLLPCKFGRSLGRFINWVVAARRKYPTCRILASKVDFKSAYRRCHLNANIALQTCTQLPEDNLAIMALRLTFGGTPCPYEWCVISESICDLATTIMQHDDWDPATLHAPQPELVPLPKYVEEDVPLAVGRELVVDIPVNPRGVGECYIDDLVGATVEIPESNHADRLSQGFLLAIAIAARELNPNEPIPREEMAALAKLLAEAGPDERKIILGWQFDFRRLLASLPMNKFVAWTEAFTNIISEGSTTAKQLEENIGRLVHLGRIIPAVFHFLSRLRTLQRRAENRRRIKLTDDCRKDLKLMLKFLAIARRGVDLNLVAYLMPTEIYRSDSCPHGLGGYTHRGWAWRFKIPAHLLFRASNNLLEHIASVITVWVELLAGRLSKGACCLSMTDSSTSEGWTHRSNFEEDDDEPVQAQVRRDVARDHSWRLLEAGVKDYSQWFPGAENDVADSLSRDFDRSNSDLVKILRSTVPQQLPQDFKIVPLPSVIVSWLTSLLWKLPAKPQLQEVHTRGKLGRGIGGPSTVTPLDSTTSSSTTSPVDSASDSWLPSPWLSATHGFRQTVMTPWLKRQSELPSAIYLRPSGSTSVLTPPRTPTASLDGFYHDSTELSRIPTRLRPNKRHFQ